MSKKVGQEVASEDGQRNSDEDIHDIDEKLEKVVTIKEIPDKYANTSPLGLLGFGMTTIMLSFANVSLYDNNCMVLGMGIFYGGIAQFTAGIFEIKKGHTFAGSAFVSYGAFWLSFVTILVGPHLFNFPGPDKNALGVYLLFWSIFTGFMFVGTLIHGHITLKLIFATLAVTFLLLSIGEFAESHIVSKIGGGVGLLCGGIAVYTGCAEIIDGEQGYTLMPI
ncbi:hypothetical protein M9Y10_006597 [Tritrichomonas musculus]|uniref:GPR1/FUN34/yaaH family protein n=1 Tax=Tritrichomonas musculus TaxID=1915356 RepID=A0ABR2JFQ3_9EUKA